MKLYWTVERAGNGWNDWWNSTCPACARTFEKRDPSRFCPDCGVRTHGCKETYRSTQFIPEKGLVLKETKEIWEFDGKGELQKVRTEHTESKSPESDKSPEFFRRYTGRWNL